MSEQITKRLHISGLTPSLSPADLSARLSHFGTIKSVDGFGLLDGVGQPRKFGYVTIETTHGMFKKCLSTLSGTTYKGAKLRIGEARPDFTERMTKEKAEGSDSETPIKKPRMHYSKFSGIEAPEMSLVTRENAPQRPGWKVMPSGRVVRKMKMRPGKPLPPLPTHLKDLSDRKSKKKKLKDPDVRTRSRIIDVTRWDGSYVTGVFLGGDEVAQVVDGRKAEIRDIEEKKKHEKKEKKEKNQHSKDKHQDKKKKETNLLDAEATVQFLSDPPPLQPAPLLAPNIGASSIQVASNPNATDLTDLTNERAQTLSFLNTYLFSSSSKTKVVNTPVDWDSDVDLDETNVLEGQNDAVNDVGEGYEVVPQEEDQEDEMEVDEDQGQEQKDKKHDDGQESRDITMEAEELTQARPPPKRNALKDLFAPREDEGGFSLLNHLDLDDDDDLDLDMVPFPTPARTTMDSQPDDLSLHPSNQPSLPAPSTSRSHQGISTQPIALDPKKPLFFPRSIALSTSSAASSPFYTHPTPEEIQKRWEENKLELTRGWKKRYREAGKVRRRRGGGIED
ncbi:hypothetical protein GGU10DRAFT_340599 [Lentinula aff. detonsa]|uniref:RRM domain-containing protein n=1 Tax=Lentinula aff. detonsa TaxID=2804958 RepID=A0AA38U051_9AGAR|nr:hypothetical protein GGU10DRAFT_340599 [Lentinula aff. detonsa]